MNWAFDDNNAKDGFARIGRRIQRSYIVALCLIGALSIAAFLALNGFIAEQGETASVINVSGRQRMLSQRIAGLSRALVDDSSETAKQRDGKLLRAAINDMEAANEYLMRGSTDLNLPGIQSPEERAFYFGAPHAIDARVGAFIAEGRELLVETDKDRAAILARRIGDRTRVDLLVALNAVVSYYEKRARATANRAEIIHLGLLIATLVTLLAEALLIFSPLARQLIKSEKTVSERQAELTYRAFQDQLTGLGNRRHLRSHVNQLVEEQNNGAPAAFALIAIDLDNFKDVNDKDGHEAGDNLLRLLAELIHAHIREDDLAYRLGGDEFLIFVATARSDIALAIADRLRVDIQALMIREYRSVTVSASFGIALAPAHGSSFDEVLANADIALYHAKATGKNTIAVFAEALRVSFEKRRDAEVFIRDALQSSAFEPFFQPQIDMRTGQVLGIEALARCRHADGHIIGPGEFLPTAEETGLIVPLGEQIIAKAIKDARALLADGVEFGRLAVNASSAQLRDRNFTRFLAATLAENAFPAERLAVEILETVLLDDDDTIEQVVNGIRGLGIAVELDDFGTGHTSIVNVNRLKIDRIKIDRSFIESIGTDDRGAHVLKAILTMSDALGVDVIAEGIETRRQQQELIALGCPKGQGFRFAKPMSTADLNTWLSAEPKKPIDIGRQAL